MTGKRELDILDISTPNSIDFVYRLRSIDTINMTPLRIKETGRVELPLAPGEYNTSGPFHFTEYLLVGDRLKSLPAGSMLDRQRDFLLVNRSGSVGGFPLFFIKKP